MMTLRIRLIFNFFVLLVVSAALISCGGGSSSSTSTNTSQASAVYTMIFDAGSSGTRVNFYKVIPGGGKYPQITLLDSQEFSDNGINDFLSGKGTIDPAAWTEDSSTGLPADYVATGCTMHASTTTGGQADVGPCVIQPLLDSMGGAMTAAGVNASQVKVELFATAGMRTMSAFNGGGYSEDQIATFYNAMKTYAQTTKGFVVGEFRTSNGNKEEGVWTWINLNDQYYNAFGGNAAYYSGSPTTRGDFEVGGSSMQVAFPTTALAVGDSNNVYTVSINGYTYNVFSKTYLGLGGDDARKFMRAYNFNNSTPSATYTGLDCFGSNANSSNTAENSGVALFNAVFFPSATTASGNPTGSLWAPTLSNAGGGTPLVMTSSGLYNLISCSSKFDNVTKNIIELPRNNYGTDSLGSQATYGSLITKVGSSSAPFVGLDGFYYTADSLGLVNGALKATFSASSFAAALSATCPDGGAGPDGDNLRAVSVCPNAAYMKNFLWQASGLFTSNSGAIFEGVVPSNLRINGNKTAVLTWSRGYLMQKYAN